MMQARRLLGSLPIVLMFAGAAAHARGSCEPGWDVAIGQPGTNGTVRALHVADLGDGPLLYAGGQFLNIGGISGRIASWDGESWASLSTGVSGEVYAIETFSIGGDPLLIAGGDITAAGGHGTNRIAAWDGENWSSLGAGVSGSVFALKAFDPGDGERLYVGGSFSSAGGSGANRIASWDGANWSTLGLGLTPMSGVVLALAVYDEGDGPALFAGGSFSGAGGAAASNIARWDGENWSPLGQGLNGTVRALAVFDDGAGPALYAGGQFSTAGGAPAARIARWRGGAWSTLGTAFTDGGAEVRDLIVFDDGSGSALYAAGAFLNVGGVQSFGIVRWDGENWTPVGDAGVLPFSGFVAALASGVVGDDVGAPWSLWMGGIFSSVGGASASRIAAWRGCAVEDPGVGNPADINGDGSVGSQDLGILLGSWGPCPPEPQACPADINGDGLVNSTDLAILLGSWGATAD